MKRNSKKHWGGSRPGSGRPPVPADEKLSERVTVNLRRSERAALRRMAGDRSDGAYLRELLIRHLARLKGRS